MSTTPLEARSPRSARAIQLTSAALLGFACIVEFAHFRTYQKKRTLDRMAFTLAAAIASGYMASEALTGDWPAW